MIDEAVEGIDQPAEDFQDYLKRVSPEYTWNWRHQLYLYPFLQRVTDGTCKRLMIFMPPRHSKSETVTVRYSAYRLKQNPKMNIIVGAYSQKLANRFSRKIRRISGSELELSEDKKSAEEWETISGGGVLSVGVGGGVTGFGADLIMIDDPVKNRAQAESETYRENAWAWFNDDMHTRLEPGGAIILTQTRWHEDDLAGRLLLEMAEEDSEQWEIVELRALAEEGEEDPLGRKPGEALLPERFDEEVLAKKRKKMGARSFAALYQQRPKPAEGSLFKRAWFSRDKIVDKAPDKLRWVRGYDLAVSTRTSADYTASFKCAFDKDGNLYIADGFRKRIEYPEQRRYVVARMKEERKTEHAIEKALHGQAFVQDLRTIKEIRGVPFKAVKVDTDKYTRALAWANLAEEGKVFLVRGSWIETFLDEVCSFTGKGDGHDDQVDAVSLAVGRLGKRGGKMHTW